MSAVPGPAPGVVEVVAAVVLRPDGSFLLAQRPPGKVYAGYWEFPGGKTEPGEPPVDALRRELHEELGIEVDVAYPWITREYVYPHAAVRLHFFRVLRWHGEPHGREDQALAWQRCEALTVTPMLPANAPVLSALRLPPVYALTAAAELGAGAFLDRLRPALERGLRLVQVREKSMARHELESFTRQVVAEARRHGARVLVNGDLAVAREAGADGVHLSASQLMAADARPDTALCGASCHNREELALAARLGADFAVLGPLRETASHPGMPPLGWNAVEECLRDCPVPVYAIGGLRAQDTETAWSRGLHGIAMLRGAWLEPPD
ncbi:MAG TPA: Nudix family hydrolase [Burkholderiales bacterium]|nr:Nudix family hydrolase [Burkholderiales bacterium]